MKTGLYWGLGMVLLSGLIEPEVMARPPVVIPHQPEVRGP